MTEYLARLKANEGPSAQLLRLTTVDGVLIGDYESFEDAVAKLGKAFVMAGNYLMTSVTAGDAND